MSTFEFLAPATAVAAARDDAPAYQRITGLKGVDADRLPGTITRTAAGYAREPQDTWNAHAHLDLFKEIARVEFAQDADPGTAEVFYTDGTTDLIKPKDLFCVERPIVTDDDETPAPAL